MFVFSYSPQGKQKERRKKKSGGDVLVRVILDFVCALLFVLVLAVCVLGDMLCIFFPFILSFLFDAHIALT